jgi:hypothetical protein
MTVPQTSAVPQFIIGHSLTAWSKEHRQVIRNVTKGLQNNRIGKKASRRIDSSAESDRAKLPSIRERISALIIAVSALGHSTDSPGSIVPSLVIKNGSAT